MSQWEPIGVEEEKGAIIAQTWFPREHRRFPPAHQQQHEAGLHGGSASYLNSLSNLQLWACSVITFPQESEEPLKGEDD